MYGLLMMKLYADEILEGRTSFDARLYPTDKRGRIAIMDSSSFRIYGTADLVDVRKITYGEFVKWHQVGPFENAQIAPWSRGGTCYAYMFENVRRLPVPVKAPKDPDAKMWTTVPDSIARSLHSQTVLF